MISVEEAKQIVFHQQLKKDFENIDIGACLGRLLAESISADRNMPPYDRVTMDGIAICYKDIERGITSWSLTATQYAGEAPAQLNTPGECIEVMTGAVLPVGCDTVIRYEDLKLVIGEKGEKQFQLIEAIIKFGQNIHYAGSDKKQGDLLLEVGHQIGATDIALLATVGKKTVKVYRQPSVVVISTGDELKQIEDTPEPFQIRASNHVMVEAALKDLGIVADKFLMRDDLEQLKKLLEKCLKQYDIIVLTGAVSKGKADFIPAILNELKVNKLFHGVAQRPAKPFWFGKKENCVVFAMPGNPVSAAVCIYVYLVPYLKKIAGIKTLKSMVRLSEEVSFKPLLTYFMQAKVSQNERGELIATPFHGNGSGDLTNLSYINAFVALPAELQHFETSNYYEAYFIRNFIY